MDVDIYKLKPPTLNITRYVVVKAGDNVSKYMENAYYQVFLNTRKTISIEPTDKRVGLNCEEAIENINNLGFYLYSAITPTTIPKEPSKEEIEQTLRDYRRSLTNRKR